MQKSTEIQGHLFRFKAYKSSPGIYQLEGNILMKWNSPKNLKIWIQILHSAYFGTYAYSSSYQSTCLVLEPQNSLMFRLNPCLL